MPLTVSVLSSLSRACRTRELRKVSDAELKRLYNTIVVIYLFAWIEQMPIRWRQVDKQRQIMAAHRKRNHGRYISNEVKLDYHLHLKSLVRAAKTTESVFKKDKKTLFDIKYEALERELSL